MQPDLSQVLIVIPARMQASRLPGKPMADIAGQPMIAHVLKRAEEARAGRVVVATDAEEIFQAVVRTGGEAVMTRPDHASGSDRVFEAVTALDPDGRFQVIVNLQGDLPTLEPRLIRACLDPLEDEAVDIATLAAQIVENEEKTNPNVVKAVATPLAQAHRLRAGATERHGAGERALTRT